MRERMRRHSILILFVLIIVGFITGFLIAGPLETHAQEKCNSLHGTLTYEGKTWICTVDGKTVYKL